MPVAADRAAEAAAAAVATAEIKAPREDKKKEVLKLRNDRPASSNFFGRFSSLCVLHLSTIPQLALSVPHLMKPVRAPRCAYPTLENCTEYVAAMSSLGVFHNDGKGKKLSRYFHSLR